MRLRLERHGGAGLDVVTAVNVLARAVGAVALVHVPGVADGDVARAGREHLKLLNGGRARSGGRCAADDRAREQPHPDQGQH